MQGEERPEGYRQLNFGDVYNPHIFFAMVENLRSFHRNPGGSLPLTQTPFEQTRTWMRLAKEQKSYLPPEMPRMEWLAEQIEAAVMAAGINFVPCHNDYWDGAVPLQRGDARPEADRFRVCGNE